MIEFIPAALMLIGMQLSPVPQTADSIAHATTFDLQFRGVRVVACTVTATSGNPEVDRYICDAARRCGDTHRTTEKRDACIAMKREELIARISKQPERG